MPGEGRSAGGRAQASPSGSATEPDPTRVVIVGGGVAGLVAARDIARPGFTVTLLEAADAVGGCLRSREVAGLRLDVGAESFATRGGAVAELLSELGLDDDVARPNPAGAWLRLADRTVPMPKAGILGIPSSPLARDVIAAIGWRGAMRAYLDRLMPVMKIGHERNLGRLVRRRMGAAVLERLVAPVAMGVYSARPDELDIAVVAPGLNGALTRNGSLSGAVGELREAAKAGSAVGGIVGGMARLVDVLASDIVARGGAIRTGARVAGIAPPGPSGSETEGVEGGRWRVVLGDGEALDADAVLVALPGAAALAVLGEASVATRELGELDWPEPTSVEIATLVLDAAALDAAPRGTGLLVAEDAHGPIAAKALTHASVKWPWLAAAAGSSRHVLRLSYGRAGDAAGDLDDGAFRDRALADASALLDIPLAASSVVGFSRTRWTNALPYAALGQRARIDAVRAALDGVEGIEATGAWLTGTGLASVVPDARNAARRIRGLRWKALTENH